MLGQVIMSIAYGIDALPENDKYVEGAEMMMKALAAGSTQEAALLDAIPWCMDLLPRYLEIWILMDSRTVIKLPSWLPGARFKRYAQEWYPIVARAVEAPYEKVKRELVGVAGSHCSQSRRCIHLDCWNGNSLCRREYYIEP